MLRSFIISFIVSFIGFFAVTTWYVSQQILASEKNRVPWWSIQSVDTMKYSRDLSREKMRDETFNDIIDQQIKNIAQLGATHVGIATPYDEEFIPMLSRWVSAARKYNLKVWFRGNFSGWEQWFDYKRITREEHLRLTKTFITSSAQLFEDGDIFTPCPECENGGPGDPRNTGDITGHRLFLIKEYETATAAFRKIGIGVNVGYFSMNYDVAKAIMDRQTTEALGGIVTIDHYVSSPERLISDIRTITEQSGGNVFLGEFGAPIPDIHGKMNEQQQSDWLAKTLDLLKREKRILGINYWVNVGGSTQLWTGNGTSRAAVKTINNSYSPKTITGKLVDQLYKPITNVDITSRYKKVKTDRSGQFTIPYLSDETELRITSEDYSYRTINISDLTQQNKIIIEKKHLSLLENVLAYIINLFSKPK